MYLVEALLFISSLAQDDEKEAIACEVLMPSHNPALGKYLFNTAYVKFFECMNLILFILPICSM